MTSYSKLPTRPRASAQYVGWGAFLTLAGLPVVLGASTLVGLEGDPTAVVWLGLVIVVVGAAVLGLGLNWCVQHIDRSAGAEAGYGEVLAEGLTKPDED